MSTPSLRPQFRMPLALPPDRAMQALEDRLEAGSAPIESQRAGHHMTLTVSSKVRHLWSPWLNLEFEAPPPLEGDHSETLTVPEPTSAAQTSLHARFSPAPSLWTGFMAVYFSLATAGFFALMWALAQWTMGSRPAALWVTLACGLGCGTLWWVSLIGQRLAQDQMHLLRDAVEQALLEPVHTPAPS